MSVIGIIANPASGKDIRRLVARASVFDNQEKQAIIRRALAGIQASAGDACRIAYLDDPQGICRRAVAEVPGIASSAVTATRTASAMDTRSAAAALRDEDCRVVMVLGGDGTNRAVASAWPDAPLIALSTGTNNVFPSLMEATIAGAAAGLVARDLVPLADVARQCKCIHVRIDGEDDDIALIDAVLSRERFVGSRALLSPDSLRTVCLTRADPAAVGMTAIGGLLDPMDDAADEGQVIDLGRGGTILNAPIAPGHYRPVHIEGWRRVPLGQPVQVSGPGVLAFDGERERVLRPDQRATMTVVRSGPRVIDVARALSLGAQRHAFRLDPGACRADGAGGVQS